MKIKAEQLLTKKEIKAAEYKAETDLEDIYSRHETCRDAFNCSPLEYIEKCKLEAQLNKAAPLIAQVERERIRVNFSTDTKPDGSKLLFMSEKCWLSLSGEKGG